MLYACELTNINIGASSTATLRRDGDIDFVVVVVVDNCVNVCLFVCM